MDCACGQLNAMQFLLDWRDERAPRADHCKGALLARAIDQQRDEVVDVLQRCVGRIPRGQRMLEDCWGALVWRTIDGDGEVGGRRRRHVGHFCARGRVAPNGDACCAKCVR
ncbi:hypothetical protein FOA52_001078 [Chlamydomonas sp. UWO 241]|nr:hypothetical protein FOA52_001078 [Chlamydomonas sp. UWO 241]